jgi:glycosyltransferase involved in cell wall biosynthesis
MVSRVAVVTGPLDPTNLEVWRQCHLMGLDVHIFGSLEPYAEAVWYEVRSPGWGTVHLQKAVSFRPSFSWHYYPRLTKELRSLDPDVVVVRAEPWSLMSLKVTGAFARRTPIVLGSAENTSLTHGNPVARVLRPRLARWTLSRSAGFIGWTTDNISIARANGLREGSPAALSPSVPDPDPFLEAAAARAETRSRHGLGHELTYGFVGNLSLRKGTDVLIRAFARMAMPGAVLVIAGDGAQSSAYRSLAVTLGANVMFLGTVARDEIPNLMAAIDILVVPSRTTPGGSEQFGRVLVEAMFAGIPVIASKSGSIPKVVGQHGILVPEGDENSLVEAMKILQAPEKRGEIADEARRYALSTYHPRVVAASTIELLNRASEWFARRG